GKALTRSLKPIPNKMLRTELERGALFDGFDGELIWPGQPFQQTTSAVMSHDGDACHVEYRVFDYIIDNDAASSPFRDRFFLARRLVEQLTEKWSRLKLVPHTAIESPADLERYESRMLIEGHEGIMLRDPNGPYKFGRATMREGWLMKVKRFEDA